MMRQSLPGVVLLSACFSGAHDAALQSMVETLSHSGITMADMWVEVADRVALVYDVEFIRALAVASQIAFRGLGLADDGCIIAA